MIKVIFFNKNKSYTIDKTKSKKIKLYTNYNIQVNEVLF